MQNGHGNLNVRDFYSKQMCYIEISFSSSSFETVGGNLVDIVQWICGLAMTVKTNDEQK